MALTEVQKTLIQGLVEYGVEKEAIPGIILSLKTEEKQWEMIDYLLDNRQATQTDILMKLVEIVRQKK